MAFHLQAFDDIGLTTELLAVLLDDHERATLPRLSRLWAYYRNPMRHTGSAECASPVARPYRLGQEAGLPPRLRGSSSSLADDRSRTTEVVIENDIAWRIDAMVDFAFGKPVTILSTARDAKVRAVIERVLDAVWESSGGIALLQDMSLLGAVYGFVDFIVRTEELSGGSPQRADAGAPPTTPEALDEIVGLAERLRIELVEAPRAIPILDPGDYRRIVGYIIRSHQHQERSELGTPVLPRGPAELREFCRPGCQGRRRRLIRLAARHMAERAPGRRRPSPRFSWLLRVCRRECLGTNRARSDRSALRFASPRL